MKMSYININSYDFAALACAVRQPCACVEERRQEERQEAEPHGRHPQLHPAATRVGGDGPAVGPEGQLIC
jgi:hypothetical protein